MGLQEYLRQLPAENEDVHLIGPFYSHSTLPNGPKIYVDRGVQFRMLKEGYAVGDGDSSKEGLDEVLDPKKDYSDLSYVFRNLDEHLTNIHLHGFLGGRRDHEMMNLAEGHSFLKWKKKKTSLRFDEQVLAMSAGEWEFPALGTFSIFAFEKVSAQLWGRCEYKLPERTTIRPLSSHGLSNIGSGAVNLICDAPLFVFFNSAERLYQ